MLHLVIFRYANYLYIIPNKDYGSLLWWLSLLKKREKNGEIVIKLVQK